MKENFHNSKQPFVVNTADQNVKLPDFIVHYRQITIVHIFGDAGDLIYGKSFVRVFYTSIGIILLFDCPTGSLQ